MFERFKALFSISAAAQLAPLPPPKVRPGARALPSFLKTVKGSSTLPRDDRRLINKDLTAYRTGVTTRQVMRDMVASSPDLSAAVFSYLRLALTNKYRAVTRNPDGSANPEATALLQQLLARFDTMSDPTLGFSLSTSLQSISEAWGRELLTYGACSGELVLDKARLPSYIQPLSVSNIEFKQDGVTVSPVQKMSGDERDLDVPTFFYTALDQDLLDPYASSPMEPALKAVLFSETFMNDLQRIMSRVVHPRQRVSINTEKFLENISAEAHHDAEKLAEEQNRIITDLESKINGLKPEDALVHFDFIEVTVDNNGNISLSDEWKMLQDLSNARLASGSKTGPFVLGHEVGSSNVASTSSMLFVKNATVIKNKIDEMYSRMLTLALRLFGHDVYVEFRYADIDLRPEAELASFRQTNQAIILEQLSLGLISDDEAALALTGHLPPKGYKPLSGTMFKSASAHSAGGTGPNNDASTPSNGGSTLNQKLAPDTPSQGRGGNKKAEAEVVDIRSAL